MIRDYLQQICDNFPDAVCITNRDGIIVLTNTKYADVYGFSHKAVLGQSVIDMERKGIFNNILNPVIINTGQTTTHVQHTLDGRELVLEGHPIKDQSGNVVYCMTFIRDVTSLTRMREQLNIQSKLLDIFQRISKDFYQPPRYPNVITSAAMCALYANCQTIAGTDATVLILGETGVGKDVLARAIYDSSKRADGPFIKIDCGSIPENLIETELFGYEEGAFSGASKKGKIGLIEAGDGGTVFMDEIAELPFPMQSRMLRVLQDKEVKRVGATKVRRLDVRFIVATNRDLEKEVEQGHFRRDLYYRLKVGVLTVPPLRQRKADILPLARAFLKFYGEKHHQVKRFTEESEKALQNYSWPGNVRELENMIQGLVVSTRTGIIHLEDLPFFRSGIKAKQENNIHPLLSRPLSGKSYKEIMRELEYDLLEELMDTYGTITEIARNFSVDRSTIFRKVKAMKKVRDANSLRAD